MKWLAVPVTCLSLLGVGCRLETAVRSNAPDTLELEERAMKVLASECMACHNSSAALGGLANVVDKELLIDEGFLIPGQPMQSSIYTEAASDQMPPARPLSAADKQVLFDWINRLTPPEIPPNSGGFGALQATVIVPQCLRCHGAGQAVNLSTYSSVLNYVIPTKPEFSVLYQTLAAPGRAEHRVEGEALRQVGDWIKAGAAP